VPFGELPYYECPTYLLLTVNMMSMALTCFSDKSRSTTH